MIMMDRGEMNTGNTAYREKNYYVGWRGVNSRMSLYSSLVSSCLSVVLLSDDSSSMQRRALCIFHSCNLVWLKYRLLVFYLNFLYSIVPLFFKIFSSFFFPLPNVSNCPLYFQNVFFFLSVIKPLTFVIVFLCNHNNFTSVHFLGF